MINHDDNAGTTADQRLSQALRAARPSPALPPRFQQEVWRRIEASEAPRQVATTFWLDELLGWLLRPRILLAGAAALVVVSGAAGVLDGSVATRQAAKAHYLAAVAPNTLR